MKKLFLSIFICLGFTGCDTEEAPGCIRTTGDIVTEEIFTGAFEEIIVYDRVQLFISQGSERKVVIETGENLRQDVKVVVENNRLSIRNEVTCNLLRDYGVTKAYVTLPELSWLQNSSRFAIESRGVLKFKELWLRSFNQERDPGVNTNGDFHLELEVDKLRITNDNISSYFLSGKAGSANFYFANGVGRVEAADLVVQHYEIMHRSSNKLIINPRQSLKGDIYGFGDVIAVHRPPVVNVQEHWEGRLIFDTP